MNKVINIIKSKKFIYTLIPLLIVFILAIFFLSIKNRNYQERQTENLYLQEITPGESDKNDVINKIGQPKNEFKWNNYDVFNYPNEAQKWNNQIFFKNGKVDLVIEQNPENNQKKNEFIGKYGNPEVILYGDLSPTFNLLGYPRFGLAVVASSYGDDIFQTWYFQPTSIENFIKNIAQPQSYSTTQPEEKE